MSAGRMKKNFENPTNVVPSIPRLPEEIELLIQEEIKNRETFNCTGCGKCCTYGPYMGSMSAHEEDLQRWEDEDRQDILDTANIWGDGEFRTAYLWIDPKTGDEVTSGICPWVKKIGKDNWHCTIHELRPNVCRNYPVSREQRDQFECPGYWDDEKES
jgi:Fe-S-cluster containining protein